MSLRAKRWLAGTVAVLCAYAALGFLVVPWVAKSQAATFVQEKMHRRLEIGEFHFNPFTLRAEAGTLKLAEQDGTALAGIGHLVVRLEWRSLLPGAWRFGEIRFADPAVNLVIAQDGRFNFAELAKSLSEGESRKPAGKELPGLVIEHFVVERGRVDMHDKQAGYVNAFSPIDFDVEGFSTLANESDSHVFTAQWRNGGSLRWKGHSSVIPLHAEGEIAIEGVALREVGVYLRSRGGVDITAGSLGATLPYSVSYADGKLDANLKRARVTAAKFAMQHGGVELDLGNAQLMLDLHVGGPGGSEVRVADGSLLLEDIVAKKAGDAPVKIERAFVEGAALDLASHRANIAKVVTQGGQLDVVRDKTGAINFSKWIPPSAPPARPATPAGPAWTFDVGRIEAGNYAVGATDEASGIRTRVQDISLAVDGAGSQLDKPVSFNVSAVAAEGGKIVAKGTVVPSSGAVKTEVQVQALDLRPLQPLLDQYVKLKFRTGQVFAQGKVETGGKQALRYDGSFGIKSLALDELTDDPFASWREVSAQRMTLSVSPGRLEIPELRVVGADAKLIIENDRSLNAARLLVARPASQPAQTPAQQSGETFPVRVRRVRVDNARLQFTDLSLRPQFSAQVHELSGVVNGLSSSGESRSQIELDGRVDEFGQARVRGELNPFKPRDNTDVRVQFRNVDMVPASPYSMKFAGYRIAGGKISLDLQYKVRASKLEGDNKIVIDQLTLGERIDSPDAMKIPLELAIAILKDSDGRIDLGLPVSGDMDDPQFSYGAIVWKAIGNVLTKIVTAPFRALGGMLGIDADKLEAVTFDAGSSALQPPEREKLKQVAQVLSKRAGLKLAVPAGYSSAADGAAMRMMAVRREVSQMAGINVAAGEQPGPLDIADRKVRSALRDLYAKRFGDAELDKAKKAAESAPAAGAASSPSLPVWQRAVKMVQGEPQVADAGAFYTGLRERLEKEQPLPPDALTKLGADRAQAIEASLTQSGVDASRISTSPPQAVESPPGQPVPLKLGLDAR